MKQNENRPTSDKNIDTLSRGEESSSSKIQEHLQDENHILTDDDIRSITIETGSTEALGEDLDPDEENKVGLDSPWNIFS